MMVYIRNLTAAVVLGTLGPPTTSSAIAQLSASTHTKMPIENLKGTYLQCERAAVTGKLVTGDIMLCSVIYEELNSELSTGTSSD